MVVWWADPWSYLLTFGTKIDSVFLTSFIYYFDSFVEALIWWDSYGLVEDY